MCVHGKDKRSPLRQHLIQLPGPDGLPDASIEGEIVQIFNGGKAKAGGSERKAGTFRATLLRRLTAAEEAAATDSAAAGGAPQALELTPRLDERLVYK